MSDDIYLGNDMSTDVFFLKKTTDAKWKMTRKNEKNASCVKVIGVSILAILVVICVSAVTAMVTVHLMETNRLGNSLLVHLFISCKPFFCANFSIRLNINVLHFH